MPGNLYLREPLEILGTGGADRPDTVGGLHAPQPQAYGTTTTKLLGRKTAIPQPAAQPRTEPGKGLGEADSAQDDSDSDHEPPARTIAGQVHNPQPTVELETHKAEPQSDQVTAEPPPRARSGPRLPPPLGAARLPAPTPAAVPSGGGQAAAGHPLMLLFCSQSS